MLILRNISKQYERSKNVVLNDINLEFGDTGLVSILGPSGCGKTTLLNIIGGLDTPTKGSVFVNGICINKLKPKDLNKYHNAVIGFVYQNYNLINYLNVVDNIELINKESNIDELLKYLKLQDKKYMKIKNLSGGEKQRVAIARSIIGSPKILLCDEPTGALDIKTGNSIMELLKNISKDRLVIMVTHNKELALKYSDRVISLEDGLVMSDTNKYKCPNVNKEILKTSRVNISRLLNIIFKNIINKYKRNILSVIAFSVGLISFSLVLGISIGFNKSMEIEEKESLSKYPIFISETSSNLDNELNNIFLNEKHMDNYIYVQETEHKNIIDEKYINNLNNIKDKLNYQINTYLVNNIVLNISNKKIDELNLISGRNIENKNELILIISNKTIDKSTITNLGLSGNKFKQEDFLDRELKIKKEKYKIVGVAEISENSYLNTLSGLLGYQEFSNSLPIAVTLYPHDYKSKQDILKHLNTTPEVEYTDYSTTIKSLSKTIMDGITIVLLTFSSISLLVSTIMIGIISYISILERIKEIGLFKSLGLNNFHIKNIFLFENIFLGIFASILSFIISKVLSIPINELLTNLTGMKNILLINPKTLSILLIISISLSIIGSILPIKKTKKLKIVDCLKYE